MASSKKDPKNDEKPIRLDDLIPSKDVRGGRRTVFGGPLPKRKPQK